MDVIDITSTMFEMGVHGKSLLLRIVSTVSSYIVSEQAFGNFVSFVSVNISAQETNYACGINRPLIIMNSSDGVIESPNYPNDYSSNSNCSWVLAVIPGTRMNIRIDDVSIENG